jgi:hypothetical protein
VKVLEQKRDTLKGSRSPTSLRRSGRPLDEANRHGVQLGVNGLHSRDGRLEKLACRDFTLSHQRRKPEAVVRRVVVESNSTAGATDRGVEPRPETGVSEARQTTGERRRT